MAKVLGTRRNLVKYELGGIKETLRKLRQAEIKITNGADLGALRAASFAEEEVKESIAGNRSEVKSVDTGLLINSIKTKRISSGVSMVAPARKVYPGTTTNTQEVMLLLEAGTSFQGKRSHFANTEARNLKNFRNIIDTEIKQNLAARGKVFGSVLQSVSKSI